MKVGVIHGDEQVLVLLKKFLEKVEKDEGITPRPSEDVLFTTKPDEIMSLVNEVPLSEALCIISSQRLRGMTGTVLAKNAKHARPGILFVLYTITFAFGQEGNEYIDIFIENDASVERTRLVVRSIIDIQQMHTTRNLH